MEVMSPDLIVKIAVYDEQAKIVAQLKGGEFLAIKNLRLRPSNANEGNLVGRLGGDGRLIHKLAPKLSANEDLVALLQYVTSTTARAYWLHTHLICRRKADFIEAAKAKQKALSKPSKPGPRKKAEPEPKANSPLLLPPMAVKAFANPALKMDEERPLPRPYSIQRVLDYQHCPRRFRVVARISDMWPKKLEDCVGMYCPDCKEECVLHVCALLCPPAN